MPDSAYNQHRGHLNNHGNRIISGGAIDHVAADAKQKLQPRTWNGKSARRTKIATATKMQEKRKCSKISEFRPAFQQSAPGIVRTALSIEPRNGHLHVFLPPLSTMASFMSLLKLSSKPLKQAVIRFYSKAIHHHVTPKLNNLPLPPTPACSKLIFRQSPPGAIKSRKPNKCMIPAIIFISRQINLMSTVGIPVPAAAVTSSWAAQPPPIVRGSGDRICSPVY